MSKLKTITATCFFLAILAWPTLSQETQQIEPAWVAPIEVETNAYLGPENAVLCQPDDTGCVQPIIVSVLCDASQVTSCRNISQAVRHSKNLYLLYPFRSTKEEQNLTPDVTVLYTYNRELGSHAITMIPGDLSILGVEELRNPTSFLIESFSWISVPESVISMPLLEKESLPERIENFLKSMVQK
jgi:hypothetical protein